LGTKIDEIEIRVRKVPGESRYTLLAGVCTHLEGIKVLGIEARGSVKSAR